MDRFHSSTWPVCALWACTRLCDCKNNNNNNNTAPCNTFDPFDCSRGLLLSNFNFPNCYCRCLSFRPFADEISFMLYTLCPFVCVWIVFDILFTLDRHPWLVYSNVIWGEKWLFLINGIENAITAAVLYTTSSGLKFKYIDQYYEEKQLVCVRRAASRQTPTKIHLWNSPQYFDKKNTMEARLPYLFYTWDEPKFIDFNGFFV